MNQLRRKIIANDLPVILYELIPPVDGLGEATIYAYAECAAELAGSTSVNIDAFNFPEIRSENGKGDRNQVFKKKIDPREFASYLKKAIDEQEIIVNHCTVYEDHQYQKTWLRDTTDVFKINNVILVGGESSKVQYPGPSVNEMLQLITSEYGQKFLCGGITIPSRRKEQKNLDEPFRLLKKSQGGIDFFTSQVLYEPYYITQLLKDYHDICIEYKINPRRIFLSFAPVSSRKDIQFLKWLGVEIPQSIEDRLLKADIGIGWRSVQVAHEILQEILEFISNNAINVPVGLNIEHITQHNFEITKEFLDQLGGCYNNYYTHLSCD